MSLAKSAVGMLASAFLLSGCVHFLPSYDAALYDEVVGVNGELDKIEAAVTAVYSPAPSFDKVEGFYVAAVAHLTEAERIATGQRLYYSGQLAAEPAGLIAAAIGNCRRAVTAVMERHRRAPIDAAAWSVLALEEVCGVPALMVGRLNRN
ncbi:hypothetical protein [Brevundimonas sp.]|uniref:hypothetical protein n=1 Tax=Brevundimonas sp. TaxID=1871086 RepID=UPI002AB8EC3B|nr:hypothetical protein [Brevundimonas sp.]MDZ4363073.1 hypothetical protein [Brevundimonas sp.]